MVGKATRCYQIKDDDGRNFYLAIVARANELSSNRKNITEIVRIQLQLPDDKSVEKRLKWDTFQRHYKRFQKMFIAFVIMNNFRAVTIEQCKEYIWNALDNNVTKRRLQDFEKTFSQKCVFEVCRKTI